MNNILAALMFFTRLPLWKIKVVPRECFTHIVSYWSFSGWITGGTMAMVYCVSSYFFTAGVSVILALLSRIMLTGALHEDGLADFFDGMGGGRDKDSILRIMKDSHIGSYGVLSLVFYFLLAYSVLSSVPHSYIPFILICGDTFCKFVCGHITNILPYARKEEESKSKVVYDRMSLKERIVSVLGGVVPLALLPLQCAFALLVPVMIFLFLVRYIRNRIGGYTGDCCGAVFLLSEMGFWLGAAGLLTII